MSERIARAALASWLTGAALLGGALPVLLAVPAQAGIAAVDAARIHALAEGMQIGPLMAVIREEGLAYGAELDRSMMGGAGGVQWRAEVARSYDPDAGAKAIEASLLQTFTSDPANLPDLETFYASDLGHKVTGLEVAARRAFLDEGAKDAASVAWMDMLDRHDPRVDKLRHMVEALGLIDQNVQGTLNSSLAFYTGLAEGGGMPHPLTETDILTEVSGQEAQTRAAAMAWLYPYMALAYSQLSDAELDRYIAFALSPAGRKVNAAGTQAFDGLFTAISHQLGLAASHRMAGQDI